MENALIRAVFRLATLAAALFVAACAAPPPPRPAAPPAPPAPPTFQSHLDRLGVDDRIPKRGKAILVNVPGFEVIAFEDGEPVIRSRAIVGSARNPTPLVETWTSVVRFPPSWRPTPEMVRSGAYADPVRPPGPKNPLGLAAIRLEPGMLVYLHGTNRPTLFERDQRALSHGCVRVEAWDRLVAWLLGMDLAGVHDHANGRRSFDMPTDPVPVTLGYFTTFPDDAGRPVEHADIDRIGTRTARNP